CTTLRPCAPTRQRHRPVRSMQSRRSHPDMRAAGGFRRRAGRGALFSRNIPSCLILLNLSERHAIIVGGTSGIGRCVAEHLAARGESVVITGREADGGAARGAWFVLTGGEAERASAIAAEIGGSVRGLSLDLGRPEEIASALADVE